MSRAFVLTGSILTAAVAVSIAEAGRGGLNRIQDDPFRQLEELLPTPGDTRTASGAPGAEYWQQQVDYDIDVEIDDEKQRLIGHERVTYQNNSPDTLRYLWMQLDANIYSPGSAAALTRSNPGFDRVPYGSLERVLESGKFDGSVKLAKVTDKRGNPLKYTVVDTMMRIDLPDPLPSGAKTVFEVDWSYAINDSDKVGGRTGFERFEEDGNIIYEIAQWFPRAAVYKDSTGWQHKQFLGSGEFTLEFGDYDVRITVPDDHIVAATGELQNARKVLSKAQFQRWKDVQKSYEQAFIVKPNEAKKNEKSKPKGKKTWRFKAKNVRDFAFATSRKFIWDARKVKVGDDDVMAMSYYPNEGEPLWSRYSTHAVAHTLEVYSRYTFDYPYPVAISVNGPVGGMEYPMICFNGPRPEEDGTYSKRTKYGLISVVIHEVGHNFFPMIVNSDERQWTWMDEGLNTFVQYLAEQEWEKGYPSRRGEPRNIVEFMASDYQVPIMTQSDSLLQFGNNAYAKTATALNVLRETVLGRELFDFAFKEYARRWQFRHPAPADFFRTMEDASGVDLDWFWRGWFYTTDHTDQAIASVKRFAIDTRDPDVEKPIKKEKREGPPSVSRQRNEGLKKRADRYPDLKDFYNEYDPLNVTEDDRKKFKEYMDGLEPNERAAIQSKKNFYAVEIENVGGLVMPVILELHWKNSKKPTLMRIPAEIWRRDAKSVSKLIVDDKELEKVVLDPFLETADTDLSNNTWPPQMEETRFEVFKWEDRGKNPMQKAGLGKPKDEKKGEGKKKGKKGAAKK